MMQVIIKMNQESVWSIILKMNVKETTGKRVVAPGK
jgi:hypothetical protein